MTSDVWAAGPGVLDSFGSILPGCRKWLEGGQSYPPAAVEEALRLGEPRSLADTVQKVTKM